MIQAEGHVWRGELALAERCALRGGGLPVVGQRARACGRSGQAVVAAAKLGKLDEVEAQVREVSRIAPDFGARSAQIVCLCWGANYLMFGGRHAVADEIMAIIGELAGDLSEIDLQAVALVHQVRSVRASIAGDLGASLSGLETALLAFEQAGDLRNACTVRCNMGYLYCELGDFERAEVALRHALPAADAHGAARAGGGDPAQPGARARPARQPGRGARAWSRRRSTASSSRASSAWRAWRAPTWPRSWSRPATSTAAHAEAMRAVEILHVAPSLRVAALGAGRARAARRRGAPPRRRSRRARGGRRARALGEIEEGEAAVRLVLVECLDAERRSTTRRARRWRRRATGCSRAPPASASRRGARAS